MASESSIQHVRVVNETRSAELALRAGLANTSRTRRRGLLGRDRLSPGEGLVIVPCSGIHTFGMRFPIDVVFYGRDRRVRKVQAAVPRGRMSWSLLAKGVVELPAGTIAATDTRVGDQLRFDTDPPGAQN